MVPFDYVAPKTLSEAVNILDQNPVGARVYVGGSDIIDQIRNGRRKVTLLVDVKNVQEMNRLDYVVGEGLHIGGAVSCTRIAHCSDVIKHYPAIVEGCNLIGSIQIQNRASIGGNVCNGAPSADTVPPLLVYDAKAVTMSASGKREIPLSQFFISPGKTALNPGELLVEIIVPPILPDSSGHYLRFIPREEMDIAVAGAASMISIDKSTSRCGVARVALASVAPTPVRAIEVEKFLEGEILTWDKVRMAAELSPLSTSPISDVRGSADYRAELCKVLTRRTLEHCLSDLKL